MSAVPTPCRFGYEEHDGARYCFEHGGFLEAGVQSRRCDTARSLLRPIPPDDLCHNGHPFVPGVSTDHAPGESDPRWCNTCGEARVIPPGKGEAL